MTQVDVGDAFELTFTTAPSATVTVSWYDMDRAPVYENDPVAEFPAVSGKFPRTFIATAPGMWQVVFTASGTATQVEEHWVRASSVTGPPPLAALGDVSIPFGPMTPAQEGLAKYLLRIASQMVRAQFPLVDAQIRDAALNGDVVANTVATMVLRVLHNPQGLRAKTVGPFSYTYDVSLAAGELIISPNDATTLTPPALAAAAAATAFGTIRIKAGLAPPVRRHCGW